MSYFFSIVKFLLKYLIDLYLKCLIDLISCNVYKHLYYQQ